MGKYHYDGEYDKKCGNKDRSSNMNINMNVNVDGGNGNTPIRKI